MCGEAPLRRIAPIILRLCRRSDLNGVNTRKHWPKAAAQPRRAIASFIGKAELFRTSNGIAEDFRPEREF